MGPGSMQYAKGHAGDRTPSESEIHLLCQECLHAPDGANGIQQDEDTSHERPTGEADLR